MTLEPYKGDKRSDKKDSPNKFSSTMTDHSSFNWVPSQGSPSSVFEHILHALIKLVAWFPLYIIILIIICILLQVYVTSFLF